MDRITVWFVRASLVYLLVGTFLGVLAAGHPRLLGTLRSAHVHLNLAGFMTMMIFGVSHHIFPRFSGRPLYSRRLVAATFWLGNLGVLGMALGFAVGLPSMVVGFGVMMFLAVTAFVVNLFCTFSAPASAGLGCGGGAQRVIPISLRPSGGR
jgi:cbb3-type cytochrome oxidase subunit 1